MIVADFHSTQGYLVIAGDVFHHFVIHIIPTPTTRY